MEQMRFKISSALKDLIGKDLITNDNVAIFELVKNSYDAYATKVEITFEEDKIIIADNGKGMTFNDVRDKWLFLGFSAKKDGSEDRDIKNASYRDNIKRHYAGAKGIGRFSCDRLGKKLLLSTKSSLSSHIEQIYVDWGRFEQDQKTEFAQIDVEYAQKETGILFPNNGTTGTVLEISSLDKKSIWSRKKILELKRSLEKLINPLSEANDFEIEIICERELEKDKEERSNNKHDRDIVNGILTNSISSILNIKTTLIDIKLSGSRIYTKIADRGVDIYKISENP
jgi:HSP90 family molecular chaperone